MAASPFDMMSVMKLSVHEQAKFCDGVVASAVYHQKEEFLLRDLKNSLQNAPLIEEHWNLEKLSNSIASHPRNFGDWNTTSLGNLARLVESSKNEEVRKTAADLLSKFNTYMAPLISA